MASFTALNIEPDDQSYDEIDNTREIQIEDALKLYTTALKLHAQGVPYYPEAAKAYQNLFQSEIFSYPEAVTEFTRLEKHPELEYVDSAIPIELDIGPAAVDGTPSTLPQILYLAYKNHGQFILDCMKARLRNSRGLMNDAENLATLELQAKVSIDDFGRALVSDESDTELWRRAARVGAMLGSRRISRYCLEAAVEVDDDPTVAEVEPLTLEEGFAGEQLKSVLEVLADELSLSHPIMGPFKKKAMPQFLKKHIDPYPFLPDPTNTLSRSRDNNDEPLQILQGRAIINVPERSWTSIGHEICGAAQSLPLVGIILALPPGEDQTFSPGPILGEQHGENQPANDTVMTISPVAESFGNGTPNTNNSDERTGEVPAAANVQLSDAHLPTRKRSQSTAGLRDTPEEDNSTHKRSRRIRNRESTAETPVDPATQHAEQLKAFSRADDDVFTFVGNMLKKLGVEDLGTREDIQVALAVDRATERDDIRTNTAVRDLRDIMKSWDEVKANTFENANVADVLGTSGGSANAGLSAFLEHSNSGSQNLTSRPPFAEFGGISWFAYKVEKNWMPLQDVVFEWLRIVLVTYLQRQWSPELKVATVRMISFLDADVYDRVRSDLELSRSSGESPAQISQLEEMTETIFELHLDVYTRITTPDSRVGMDIRIMTKDRLDRWANFSAFVMRSRKYEQDDELSLRYLWASVYYATVAEDVTRDHKVHLWTNLRDILTKAEKPPIQLTNNAVISEISTSAADREVSSLTTMEFFQNLFQADRSDPLAIIQTLEPVLDPESTSQSTEIEIADSQDSEFSQNGDATPAILRDMWKFLDNGSTSLRLFLWQRLSEAYTSIGYKTKVFSCSLKCIEILVAEFRSEDYLNCEDEIRRQKMLVSLKALDQLLVPALTTALNEATTCFEIIDDRHIKSTCAALAQLIRVLHAAAVFDDEVRVGSISLPQNGIYSVHGSFTTFANKIKEMQVRTWALQYAMVKEATTQNRDLFLTPDNDLADFLALVHYSLGLRKCCKASNKIFLKMMKQEMSRLKHIDKWEDYLGQVLFDLYGIKLGVGTFLLEDHSCPIEPLDRRTVMNIAEQVISLANSMPMKDLMKHELKPTIEKMQTAVGEPKGTPTMLHNSRNITEYLKTPIRPLDMYLAFRGQAQIDSISVHTPESPLAEKGWYYLLGMLALTKYRSAKRVSAGSQTDDLKFATYFMKLQLQYTVDNWEAWYRLAQCYDLELEEEVSWSADKMNNDRPGLVRLQKCSVHCYIMALSTAMRCADGSFGTAEKLSDMYHDFGMRLYASSREPFSMEVFWVEEEKHMSGSEGMYKKMPFEEMSPYKLWKYASELFKRSLMDRPDFWMNHFMLVKCQWKMIGIAREEWPTNPPANVPTVDMVLSTLVRAIELCPKPTKSSQEPVLEPHYKLVSLVHKLVARKEMEFQDAAKLLQDQPYGPRKSDPFVIESDEDWEIFILACFRQLRNSDKQHWHHRMIARVANIIYDESDPDYVQACAARIEFRESIFTKAMSMQVWKPETERPGRHFVYMKRYALFMARILFLIGDKANMELLAKRVRKRALDYFKFNDVWNECCTIYLRLIRKAADIPANVDEVFRGISQEVFDAYSERLDESIKDGSLSHPALDALRETIELKKLNNGLAKITPIDDMINDIWAVLYIQVVRDTPAIDVATLQQSQIDGEAAARASGPMSLNHVLMNTDSNISAPPPIVEPPRPRKLGINRKAVILRAEQSIHRAADATRPAVASRPRNAASSSVLPSNASPLISSAPRIEIPLAAPQQNSRREDSSAPGSVHDSADDESDLSDVPDMDDMDMFPNLMRRVENGSGSGGNTPGQGNNN
ncbi:Histone transcription regulator 3 [Ciborinia camelliae]|nr:Histone transcription regulator 3 [Ciborinia camelliae]